MSKKVYFYIDDVIWPFRDVTRQRPDSLFDHPFLGVLKKAHDAYGLKVQLNVFYRTDFFYGHDEFTLTEMTDAYKVEWEAASDWLKLGFHSRQEFPDYPYVNANYDDVNVDLDAIKGEIFRFAGEKSFAHAVVPHWMPISKEGCKALYDGGIRMVNVSMGERIPYNGDKESLPYGHAMRLLERRKPETTLCFRDTPDKAIYNSIAGYNHLTADEVADAFGNFKYKKDDETGLLFKKYCNGPCLNLYDVKDMESGFNELMGNVDYIGYATHEQYFYPDYFAYQPDIAEKLYRSAQLLTEAGYEYFFIEELAEA